MAKVALMATIAFWLVGVIDGLLAWQTLSRPICLAPVVGLFIGDFKTGIVLGGYLEAIFMGISAIGGSVAADSGSATVIAVCFAATQGASLGQQEAVEQAMTIAMPIGTLMSSFNSFTTPIFASLSPYWEELAAKGDMKKFRFQTLSFNILISPLIKMVTLYICVAFGTESLAALLAKMPAFVTRGLGAASGMMTGVGYAILLSMLWTAEVGPYFFAGYVLSKYLGMDSLSIAILGTVVAIAYFYQDKKIIDLKQSGATASAEEDFF